MKIFNYTCKIRSFIGENLSNKAKNISNYAKNRSKCIENMKKYKFSAQIKPMYQYFDSLPSTSFNVKLIYMCKTGLLIKKEYDAKALKEVEKVVVPQTYLHSVLTILHSKPMHPTSHQLSQVFKKYFYAPNSTKAVEEIKSKCDTCISFSRLPNLIPMEPCQKIHDPI